MDKKALFQCSYGLYIVTSKVDDQFSGCIVNTVTQVTAEDKPKLTVAVNKENYTHGLMQKSKKVAISILAQDAPFELIGRFGFRTGKQYDKLANSKSIVGSNGIPVVIEHAVAYLECDILQEIDCNTHTLFVLEMQDAKILEEKEPMTYAYYHRVLKGLTPAKASTYQEREK